MGMLTQNKEGTWAESGSLTVTDKMVNRRILFLPHTRHELMRNGSSEKLWEIPEDCFELGWILAANSVARKCKKYS